MFNRFAVVLAILGTNFVVQAVTHVQSFTNTTTPYALQDYVVDAVCTIHGSGTLHNFQVAGAASFAGWLFAKKCKFFTAHINATDHNTGWAIPVCLRQKYNLKEDVQVALIRVATTGVLTIKAEHIYCKNCSINAIVIDNATVNTQSVIELAGNTVIENNIVFENGNGKVILHRNAKINGKVIGGTITKIS